MHFSSGRGLTKGECWQQEGAQCRGGTDAHQNHPSFSFTQTTKAKFLMEKKGEKKSRFSLLDNNYRGKKKKKESNCFSCRFSSKALGTAAMKGHFAGEVANVSTEVMENIPIK